LNNNILSLFSYGESAILSITNESTTNDKLIAIQYIYYEVQE